MSILTTNIVSHLIAIRRFELVDRLTAEVFTNSLEFMLMDRRRFVFLPIV